MTTRLLAGLLLATSVSTGATVLAASDHQPSDDFDRHVRLAVREVHRAVHDGLREARREVRRAMREVRRELRVASREVAVDVRGARAQARAAARIERRAGREQARDLRAREREARLFRQISPTDDPCAESWRGDRGRACEVRDTRLPAPAGPLTVDASPNGGIRVEAWDQPDVLVRAVIQTHADDDAAARAMLPQVRVTAAGTQVGADGPDRDGGRRNQGWSVSFRIWAPRQTALALTARNGGVSLHGMRGDARFETTNGGITLDDVGGRMEGRTANGGVTVRLSGQRWDGAGLDLETTNGGVSLAVPRDYSASLEVSTVNGGFRSDLPVEVPDGRRKTLRTTLGSGGPLLRVQTVNGGVRLNAR